MRGSGRWVSNTIKVGGATDADAINETFMEYHLPPAANNANLPSGTGTQSTPGNGEPLF